MDLFARGKKRGRLDSSEMMDVLDEIELDSEQMEKIWVEEEGGDTEDRIGRCRRLSRIRRPSGLG